MKVYNKVCWNTDGNHPPDALPSTTINCVKKRTTGWKRQLRVAQPHLATKSDRKRARAGGPRVSAWFQYIAETIRTGKLRSWRGIHHPWRMGNTERTDVSCLPQLLWKAAFTAQSQRKRTARMYAYQAPIPPNRHRTVDAPKPESISSIRRRLYQKVTGEKGTPEMWEWKLWNFFSSTFFCFDYKSNKICWQKVNLFFLPASLNWYLKFLNDRTFYV